MRATKELNVKKQNHGITLIALIITIIVMLILVAVTITMAVNGGLFGQAADAGKKTNEVVALEQELGKGVIKIKKGTTIYEYDNVDAYLSNTPSKVYEEGEEPETPTEPENPEISENIQIAISGPQEVDVKKTITLIAESTSASFDASKIEWISSNPEVATVKNGVVTGVNASINNGSAYITARYNNMDYMTPITVKSVLVDCPVCETRVINDMYNGYCAECQTEKWNEFTNNAVIIGCYGNYSNLLAMEQEYAFMKIRVISKGCCGCTNGAPVSCNYCNEKGQLYDMGSCYKRVEQEQAI